MQKGEDKLNAFGFSTFARIIKRFLASIYIRYFNELLTALISGISFFGPEKAVAREPAH